MAAPLAVVMGDMDLVRPIGEAGARCVAVARHADATRWSRYVDAYLDEEAPGVVERLVDFATGRPERPLLFYEADWSLRLVSEHRERLGELYRFVVADADLVDSFADKRRFLELADRCGLEVPRSAVLAPSETEPEGGRTPSLRHKGTEPEGGRTPSLRRKGTEPDPATGMGFPAIVKPVPGRDAAWDDAFGAFSKAVRVDSPDDLARIWPHLAARGREVLLQELVPGPESAVESYHAYVDPNGEIAAEFTGRKIRTHPVEYGASCALETTESQDVVEAGRRLVQSTGLGGVLKADYKRRPDGGLALLEVNARFSLWHVLGAAAGVNIPAIVMADLTGSPRPVPARARTGVTWCDPLADVRAARELGLPLHRWAAWAARCDVLSGISVRDPMPLVRGKLLGRLRRGR